MALTAEEILKGAYFAMEQAGRLLKDACLLYRQERWPSSLMLAVFSFEECGKAEILLRLALAAAKRGPIEEATVARTARSHHAMKIERGRSPSNFVESVGAWGGSENWDELDRRLVEQIEAAVKNAPTKDHQARQRAQFVDLLDGRWVRPAEMARRDVSKLVLETSSEYATRRREFLESGDPFVAEAWKRMATVLPALPEPEYPML